MASQLHYNFRMLYRHTIISAAPTAEKTFSSALTTLHHRTLCSNPKRENLIGSAQSWLGFPSIRCPIVEEGGIGQPAESGGKNLIKEVWQETTGFSSGICYYLQHSKSVPLDLSIKPHLFSKYTIFSKNTPDLKAHGQKEIRNLEPIWVRLSVPSQSKLTPTGSVSKKLLISILLKIS